MKRRQYATLAGKEVIDPSSHSNIPHMTLYKPLYMSLLALSATFDYLCYVYMADINILILSDEVVCMSVCFQG